MTVVLVTFQCEIYDILILKYVQVKVSCPSTLQCIALFILVEHCTFSKFT